MHNQLVLSPQEIKEEKVCLDKPFQIVNHAEQGSQILPTTHSSATLTNLNSTSLHDFGWFPDQTHSTTL